MPMQEPRSPRVPDPPFAPDDPFPRFSQTEMSRRWSGLLRLLERKGCAAAIVSGAAAARHEIQYLTNAPVRWESFLIASPGDEPRLFVQLFNHMPNMGEWSTVPVSWAGSRPASTVAADLEARGRAGSRIGLIGPLSASSARRLAEALPHADLIDLDADFRSLRLVKSEEELTWAEYGAAICDAALERFLEQARPGMREDELGGLMESSVTAVGGQVGICFLVTASMADGGRVVPAQTWSRRRVGPGDMVMFELSAGFGGYTGQLLRTIAIGAEPPAEIARLHAIAVAAFDEISASLQPGATAAAIEATAASIDAAGCTVVDDVVHGYVGGYLPPVIRTPATRHAPPPPFTFEPGMCVVVQPNVVSGDGRHGVQTGELMTITESGARSLHRAPRGLLRAG